MPPPSHNFPPAAALLLLHIHIPVAAASRHTGRLGPPPRPGLDEAAATPAHQHHSPRCAPPVVAAVAQQPVGGGGRGGARGAAGPRRREHDAAAGVAGIMSVDRVGLGAAKECWGQLWSDRRQVTTLVVGQMVPTGKNLPNYLFYVRNLGLMEAYGSARLTDGSDESSVFNVQLESVGNI
ncbi:hypothetical protein Pelo_16887 [Pelomyxa schiedti]|nr:hypothetical protein Pelo_16887 [Pelomyxa schiedti]